MQIKFRILSLSINNLLIRNCSADLNCSRNSAKIPIARSSDWMHVIFFSWIVCLLRVERIYPCVSIYRCSTQIRLFWRENARKARRGWREKNRSIKSTVSGLVRSGWRRGKLFPEIRQKNQVGKSENAERENRKRKRHGGERGKDGENEEELLQLVGLLRFFFKCTASSLLSPLNRLTLGLCIFYCASCIVIRRIPELMSSLCNFGKVLFKPAILPCKKGFFFTSYLGRLYMSK